MDAREGSLTRSPPYQLRSGGGAVLAGTAGADDRAEAVGRLGQCVRSDRFPPRGVTPLTPIMGRATDPGENHDPGNDQRFTPSLTQEPRLENGLGHEDQFPPPSLSDGCQLGEATFVGTPRNGEDADIASTGA